MEFPPVFRLAALIALGALIFRYSLTAQCCLAGGLLLVATARGSDSLRQMFRALRRIRWLLLSLAVIYLFVAPEPDVSGQATLLPSWADIELALRRAGVLVLLVAAVELMRQTTPADQLAAAVRQLLRPLDWIGVDTGKFARRMALTLDAVPRTAEAVAAAAGRVGIRGRDLGGWAEAAAELVRAIEDGATHTRVGAQLPPLSPPTGPDWLRLGAVLAVILALSWV